MDNLDEFKAFLKTIPSIKEDVLNHRYTWQQIYEIYTMYGENDHFFDPYKNHSVDFNGVLEIIKNVDLNWYVKLCHYPESYDDLLEEIHQKKQDSLLEKLDRFSMIVSMLEMLQ